MIRYDVAIIGGSFAGLAAAMPLARASRSVVIIDAGRPRNRKSREIHGLFGFDGARPQDVLAMARRQVSAYGTVSFIDGAAQAAQAQEGGFCVMLDNNAAVFSRRLILAQGVCDILPEIKGIEERWGSSVLHCPYCHGYEVKGRKLGILLQLPSLHMAEMLHRDWSRDLVILTQGIEGVDGAGLARLRAAGVKVENTPVTALKGEGSALDHVILADGRHLSLDALFTVGMVTPSGHLAETLGCVMEKTALGEHIVVDEHQETSVKGVYAAGDLARPMQMAGLAAADGTRAGIYVHQSLSEDGGHV